MSEQYRYEFRETFLFLHHPNGEGAYRIDPWPAPRSMVRLLPDSEWLPCPPPVRLLQSLRSPRPRAQPGAQLEFALEIERKPSPAETKIHALRQFRASLPGAVARAVEPFREMQWEILVACSLSERFIDILNSNPALAFLWLSRCKERGFCQEGVAELLAAQVKQGGETSQRQLLRHLGLLSSKAALKLLRKCHLPALNAESGRILETLLTDPWRMRRLNHLPRLGTGILQIARSTRFLGACKPALLSEVAADPEELHRAPTAALIRDHLEFLNELGMPLRPFRSRADLLRRHRELVDGFHELRRELEANVAPPPPVVVPVPRPQPVRPTPPPPPPARVPATSSCRAESCGPPPLPGNQHIVPLTSRSELRSEGKAQSNCVGSYYPHVKRGTHYIYKVLWPERCTLSLVKNRKGVWVRGELKTAKNRATKPATQRMVDAWIASYQAIPAATK